MTIYMVEGFGAYSSTAHAAGAGAQPLLIWDSWVGSSFTVFDLETDGERVRKYAKMNPGSNLQRAGFPTLTTIAFGMRVKTIWGNILCTFNDGGFRLGSLTVMTDGRLGYSTSVASINADSVVAASSSSILANTLAYVECKIVFGNGTAGSIEFRYNGLTIGTASSIDTIGNGVGCTNILLGIATGSYSWDSATEFTDVYVADDFLFPQKYWYQPASVAGSDADWTPTGAASVQAAIDEIGHDSDTTYVSSTTVGDRCQVAHAGDATIAPKVVQPIVAARHNGGGGNIKVGVLSGATEDLSATQSVAASYYGNRGKIYETDPATSAAWTLSGYNNLELDFQHVT